MLIKIVMFTFFILQSSQSYGSFFSCEDKNRAAKTAHVEIGTNPWGILLSYFQGRLALGATLSDCTLIEYVSQGINRVGWSEYESAGENIQSVRLKWFVTRRFFLDLGAGIRRYEDGVRISSTESASGSFYTYGSILSLGYKVYWTIPLTIGVLIGEDFTPFGVWRTNTFSNKDHPSYNAIKKTAQTSKSAYVLLFNLGLAF